MKSRFAVLLGGLFVGLVCGLGCSNQVPLAADESGTVEQALTCDTNVGIYPTKAELARMVAFEMRTWDPLKQFVIVNGRVTVSPEALAACGPTACSETRAVLRYQEPEVAKYLPEYLINPVSFAEDLKASFDRQRNLEQNLRLNHPDQLPEPHALRLVEDADFGGCGLYYGFQATRPDGAPLAKPQNLGNRLGFFGYGPYGGNNPYVDFRYQDSLVWIDPESGGAVDPEGCISTPLGRLRDPDQTAVGRCCKFADPQGVTHQGTLQPLPPVPGTLYCSE